jgi:excisionase family DNA binding protein
MRQGDLYRCTAPTPCPGYALHYRARSGPCGIAAETKGRLVSWRECPGQIAAPAIASAVQYLSTNEVAARLGISTGMVAGLLAKGKLSGTKFRNRWQVPVSAIIEYHKTSPLRYRVRDSKI